MSIKVIKFFSFMILAVIFVSGNSEMFNYANGGGWLNGGVASIGMFVICGLGFNYLCFIGVKAIREWKGF